MQIYPTAREFITRTMSLCIILVSVSYCWFYKEKSDLFEKKWDEVIETAELNDLDRDGVSFITVMYETERNP